MMLFSVYYNNNNNNNNNNILKGLYYLIAKISTFKIKKTFTLKTYKKKFTFFYITMKNNMSIPIWKFNAIFNNIK